MATKTDDDRLSTLFSALADPTRRAILARLSQGEATVGELAEPFAMSLPGISKHLKVLQRARLIEQGRQAQWRPCRLQPGALKEVADWVDVLQQAVGEDALQPASSVFGGKLALGGRDGDLAEQSHL